MFPFEQPIPDGSPWIDYKEAVKTGAELRFFFRIEKFLTFHLQEIGVSYPCDINGRAQLPLVITGNISSSQNLFTPIPIPPELISSPCQIFRQGALDEAATGMRLNPVRLPYPFEKGDVYAVSITGAPVGMLVRCWIAGRKHGV